MPAEPTKAVFLSYASQDAEAARRICETLRASGIEVWFDVEGGLEHGDEWDAKIRRQIRECVLFIAIISVHTQARHEGYFRIEWELAAQRAMGFASGVAFILPIVIDDTREPDALVPDRFRMVQWTKLRGGEVPPEVQARFLKLWSQRTGTVKQEASDVARAFQPVDAADTGQETRATPKVGRRVPAAAWIAAGVAVALIAVGYFFLKRPMESAPTIAKNTGAETRPPTPEKSVAPVSEARKLLAQARALFENRNVTRDDLSLAEDLCRQGLKLDPNDAEVWAVYSELEAAFIGTGIDASPERAESSRMRAERALKLNPSSTEARLAKAVYLRRTGAPGQPEAERILRELATETPGDPRVSINLGKLLWGATGAARNLQRADEALALFVRAAAIPAGRAEALSERAWLLTNLDRFDEAEEAIDESLRLQPTTGTIGVKITLAFVQGKTDAAVAAVGRLSDEALHSDFGAGLAIMTWLGVGQPEKVLKLLASIPRDYVTGNGISGAADSWRGLAYQMLDRDEAARTAWQSALQVVERRLRDTPRAPGLLIERAQLLALLNQREAATAALKLYEQMYPAADSFVIVRVNALGVHALLDPPAGVIDRLEAMLKGTKAGFLRTDFRFATLRDHPRFKALVEQLAPAARPPEKGEVASAPDPKSVAVLPFANQSDDKANEYFSDGIAEELLIVLQKIPGLSVAARTSAWSFKGKNPTAQEVGEKLGKAHVVEGSVQKIGNRVRIRASLSRAATNEELWSQSFGPLELTDVFATQSEIAQAIVGELRGRLTGEAASAATVAAAKAKIQAQVQAATKGGTKNPEAHRLYLQGKFLAAQFSQENFARAIDAFRQATKLDASFALAWAALSRAQSVRWSWGALAGDADQIVGEARRAANRALALEPELAEGHAASFEAQVAFEFDWRGAEASARKALALAPAAAANLCNAAKIALFAGHLDAALELFRQAAALDPVNTEVLLYVANTLAQQAGREDDAALEFQRALAINPNAMALNELASNNAVFRGRLAEALAFAEREQEPWARRTAFGILRWAQRQQPEADAALREIIEYHAGDAAYNIAEVCAFRGEADQAFAWLERAYRQRDAGIAWTMCDRLFEKLHADPRWPAFLKKIGLHDEQLK